MKIFVTVMILVLSVFGEDLVVDFREAILHHGIRISLNGEEIDENQTLILSAQPTWVVGICYKEEWHKEVILRDGKYNEIRATPYSVKLDGSIGLKIPSPEYVPNPDIPEEPFRDTKKGRSLAAYVFFFLIAAAVFYFYKLITK